MTEPASPATLAAALGHTPTEPEWVTTSDTPVPPAEFGKDHYSTLLYVESRTVDHKGVLCHDHMRCDADRHPVLDAAKRRYITGGFRKYPTRLRGGVELADHDDYDCLDDMAAAGWLTVTMPQARGHRFVDVNGRTIPEIDPGFLTGLAEKQLAAWARWDLTPQGRAVAAALRAHKADGGGYGTFTLPQEVTDHG